MILMNLELEDGAGVLPVVVMDVMAQDRVRLFMKDAKRLMESADQRDCDRRLYSADAYCPHCGHNRNGSVSSIAQQDERKLCQMCGATWFEFDDQRGGDSAGGEMNYEMTAKEAIAAWDAGDSLHTIEMGGLGPGYEQAIQVCAIEILRDALAAEDAIYKVLSIDEFRAQVDATVKLINDDIGSATGAMVGAASNIAWRAYSDGWGPMLKKAKESGIEDDRFILVSKNWPRVVDQK